ncbi:F-actin-monooxygenase Mical isoform X6 [Frieseomelitta varia]|uniref:F-actin-monooxygenase Mical isoform X6 n=1 Tax=Frieseomelitta varia TaxID=561572 RepID=UPI001CB6A47C|nr:F-actin-monooxygenase Mical isoform X6 [Frieseomelitta varia]
MEHQQSRKQTMNSTEVAKANEEFDLFCNATTLKSILGHFRHLCELLKVRPNTISQFYPKLKLKLRSWKAQALWKKFDQRANHKCYNRGKACLNTRVLIIGGGPCGLRSAIEAQLLGAKVVVVEKRDRMSRNNVLHLWPFVIQDLRGLGAKKFFGKFCAGSIDHISIRQLQCILLKVALILGVEFHESVSFDSLIPPPENQEEGKIGWRAKTTPADHPVSQYEFDVLIGADGKRNTLEGFKRKEFRGKLAIAITANFINKRTEAEARVEEISGVAFIFNQKFFKELYQETGIDLENIVYYKDDTHYFVMTAKKHSLIDKGVILQDYADTAKLLAKENVDREALMLYAREAAEFSTEYQMIGMEFAVNHYGQPDVAMFDFTSMYAAENASRILDRRGHRLLMILVGDSLLEPFWPTGSGCARGFLSSLDACWAIKSWGANVSPLEVIAERESIYRLLGQTTPENLNRDYAAYTLDPHTRYPNLNVSSVTPIQVRSLLDTDDPDSIKQPTVQSDIDIPKKRRRRDLRGDSQVHPDTLLRWLQKQVAVYDSVQIKDMGASFKNGLAICAIIHRYRPNLIDFHSLNPDDAVTNNQLAFDVLEKELGIPPIMTGEEMVQCDVPDKLAMFSYLTQIYEVFRGEIPYIKHPKLEPENEERPVHSKQLSQLTPDQKVQSVDRVVRQDSATRTRHSRSRHNENLNPADKKGDTISRRSRKRRSTEKMGATVEERQKRLAEIEKNRAERMRKRQYLRNMATQQFYKSMQMLQANAKREKDEPFEDYSIFLYRQTAPDFKDRVKYLEQKILYPDREPKIHAGHHRNSIDEEFSGRIKSIEDKLKGSTTTEKKPRDLLRAIGKIEKTDWNVKEIEKKIEENKMGRSVRHDKVERVPKWSREQMCICFIQFLARQIKMEKKGRDQKETDSKYADIDNTLKSIDRKIKEGNVLGYNKVSAMAEQFSNKSQDAEPKVHKSNVKPTITLPAQGGSEMCHFCNKRVYLMERLTAEGKFFHRGCFRCEYCSTSLRIGNHTFDRDKNGGRFYCTQHFGFSGTLKARAEKKRITTLNKENIPTTPVHLKTPEKAKISLEGVVGLDLLDRGQTPERIEFENLAGISDAEEPQSQMDEDEWTDRNFGASTAEMGSSDDISDMSDSDDDNEVYEEAIDQPLTTEGTLELAKNWTLRYSHPHAAMGQSDTGSNEYEDSSDEYTNEDDESTTATEDEDDIRARELRKQEVWLKNPTRSSDTDTGSETEVKISQDSIDSITQESFTLPAQTPNLISPQEINVNNSELDQDVVSTEDIQKLSNKETVMIDTLVGNRDHQVTNDTKFVSEENASQNIASGNLICSLDSSFNLVLDSRESNTVNSDSSLIVSNPIEQNNSNKHNSVDECISEYESLIDDLLDLDRNQQIQNKSENDQVSFKFVDIGNNDVNDEVISVHENVDKIRNVENSELIQTVLSDHNETNNEVMPGPDITPETPDTPEITSTSNTKLQTVFAGIMLPDAIPFSQANYDNTVQPNIEEVVSLKERLPDLITSSPNSSRDSSPSSSCEIYKSTETLYDELLMFDTQDKITAESCDSDSSTQNYKRSTGDIPEDNKLKLFIKDSKIPIVTITSPSPTSEKSLEETPVENAKLTIPKGASGQAVQFDGNSSFDKLKRDLRQRKARNKMSVGELRPLTTENARRKIDKYFIDEKKQKAKSQNTQIQDEKSPDVKVVELDIKPKLSAKVEVKDIMKYFQKINPESSEKLNYERPENPKGKDCTNIDELNEIDVDAVVKEFEEIERQNEEIFSIDTEDIESQLHLNALLTELHLEDTNEQLNAKDVNMIEDCELPSKLHEEKQNITIDSPESITNSEQTQLVSQQINNILDTKSHENVIINPHNSAINEEQKILTSPLINDTLENTIGCHELQKTNTKQTILQPNSYTLKPELDGGKTEVTSNLHIEQTTSQLDNEIKFREEETNKQLGSENVQQAISIPYLDCNILEIKLYEQKMQNTTHSKENIKTDVKQILPTPQFNNIKNNRNEALYKSSSELTSLPVEHDQVTKVKVVEQNLEIPKHVNKMNVYSNLILSNTVEIPKRPERKHVHHKLSSSIRPDVQFAPDIPVRRKSSKQKSNVPCSLGESTCNVQLSSTAINKRLVESDINNSNTINTETNKLRHSTEMTKSNSEISKTTNTLGNTVDEQSRLTKSPPLINSDQRDSAKSIPSKNDRTKKDKCVVS